MLFFFVAVPGTNDDDMGLKGLPDLCRQVCVVVMVGGAGACAAAHAVHSVPQAEEQGAQTVRALAVVLYTLIVYACATAALMRALPVAMVGPVHAAGGGMMGLIWAHDITVSSTVQRVLTDPPTNVMAMSAYVLLAGSFAVFQDFWCM